MRFPSRTSPEFNLIEADALAEAFEVAGTMLAVDMADETVSSKLRTLVTYVGRGRLRLGIDIANATEIRAMSADVVDLVHAIRGLPVDESGANATLS